MTEFGNRIEALCLEQACRRAGIPRKAFCTSWFDVPRTPSLLAPPDSSL
ncbi:MAG TPA: hypothetical protein VJ910_05200 [Desulfuromonadales bacterium]|nr:hypothetical protein [Desulfuromonadales bacterium]